MKPGESLKSYSARYWETYNEIDLCGEDLAVRQFKFGLPIGSKIRQSLSKKPPPNMADLMSRIEQHVRVEENGLQPQKQPDNNISAQKKSVQPEASRVQRKHKAIIRGHKHHVQRTNLQNPSTNQRQAVFCMTDQDCWRPSFQEVKTILCIPQREGSLNRELQELQGILGGTGSKWTPPSIYR